MKVTSQNMKLHFCPFHCLSKLFKFYSIKYCHCCFQFYLPLWWGERADQTLDQTFEIFTFAKKLL